MSSTMELTRDHLEQIGTYVREHLGEWIRVAEPPVVVRMDAHYLERMVRIEEELKAQRELMQQGFGFMEKRFEEARENMNARFEQARVDMHARFEQVDKRFEEAREDMHARFEQVDKRFEETREDMHARFEEARADRKAGFDQARRNTNVWMTVLAIVIAIAGFAGPLIAAIIV